MDKNTAVRTATIDECITLLSFVLQETEEIFKAEYDESYDFEELKSYVMKPTVKA